MKLSFIFHSYIIGDNTPVKVYLHRILVIINVLVTNKCLHNLTKMMSCIVCAYIDIGKVHC